VFKKKCRFCLVVLIVGFWYLVHSTRTHFYSYYSLVNFFMMIFFLIITSTILFLSYLQTNIIVMKIILLLSIRRISVLYYYLLLFTLLFLIHGQSHQPHLNNDNDIIIPITNISMPLFAKSNSHHIHLYIGSPPQRRIVIVDTGSQLLVFPCKPCRKCGSHHVSGSFFDPMYSSTDVRNQCVDCVFSKTVSSKIKSF